MCRIMLIYGSNHDLILRTLNAFVEASEYDKYKVMLGSTPSHRDGWGYAAFSIIHDNRISRVIYYRSIDPIFTDNEGMYKLIDFIKENDRVLILMHSRAISMGSLNIFNTHPYHYVGKNYSLWFAHNGTMCKDDLVKVLGMKDIEAENLSDSYLLGLLLYRRIRFLSEDEIVESYREVSKYTKTAMNTIGIFTKPNKMVLAVTSSYLNNEIGDDPKRIDYYKLYELYGDDIYAVLSSTVAENIMNAYNKVRAFINELLYISITSKLEKLIVKKFRL
ncbi:MAG: class II glutamine amidotransferase [Staphylothermus sp.]|nr:class II glutamine amidotransferase [Staphylothermus sp.]